MTDVDSLPRVAGHAFTRAGLDARCCRMSSVDTTVQCQMTRGVLLQATEADVNSSGFAHSGILNSAEYAEIERERDKHAAWTDALMAAVHEISG